ncbi:MULTISPECIES: helix-turn-helix domain-containing protein [unclassified Enterococcus]|uniref:helix-turn-helix domain-containing protein n=1 Tax=unclassified Enterococcus TaxID=2608891 RepID=UPI0013EDC21E|nr:MULTISPECIES: helix-turn-helix domain-containing protein [unclassified Enterococcus]
MRKIRVSKGLKQKDVCKETITISYYSRIERNLSQPSIDIFIKLLEALHIGFDEFMFIHRGYKKDWREQKWKELTDAFHHKDLVILQAAKRELDQQETSAVIVFLKRMNDLFISRLKGSEQFEKHAGRLIQQLMQVEEWTNFETNVFITLMDQLSLESITIIVDQMLKTRKLYNVSEGYNSLYNKILVNVLFICIRSHDIKNAENYLNELSELLEINDMYTRNICLYFTGIIESFKGCKTEGERKIERAIDNFESLGMFAIAGKYKDFYEGYVQ